MTLSHTVISTPLSQSIIMIQASAYKRIFFDFFFDFFDVFFCFLIICYFKCCCQTDSLHNLYFLNSGHQNILRLTFLVDIVCLSFWARKKDNKSSFCFVLSDPVFFFFFFFLRYSRGEMKFPQRF